MSVYNNDKRIYPPLDDIASAPPDDESQIYRLKKIEEIENFFNEEIKQREKLYKKFKRYSTTVVILDHSLITATVITGSGKYRCISHWNWIAIIYRFRKCFIMSINRHCYYS